MLKVLRSQEGFLKKFADKSFMNFKHEDIGYKGAFLGRMRTAILQYKERNNKFPDKGK